MRLRRVAAGVSLFVAGIAALSVAAAEPFADILEAPGSAGLGAVVRAEKSPYLDGGTRYDLLPLYLYEGERVFLHGNRFGLRVKNSDEGSVNLFVEQRYEGFPADKVPAPLTGMGPRDTGVDIGLGWTWRGNWGRLQAELLHDVSNASGGTEARLGYAYPWRSGRWALQPSVTLAWRDAKLNDYYYGVRPAEATASRPAYAPGSGLNTSVGLYGSYDMTERWRLLAGVSRTVLDEGIRRSPIVRDRAQTTLYLGAAYDFGAYKQPGSTERTDTYVKLLHGRAGADQCILVKVLTLTCLELDRTTPTSVTALQVGKPFIERFKGWPLDFVGYVGVLRHDENGYQSDSWQVDAFMKAYYYGFPWNDRVQTRLGLGVGLSLAQRPNYQETTSQARRGRPTSRLLNYLDPSIDVSLGDLVGSRALKDTFIGVGVSHRSGIFGSSRLLGNVNGGSNYIYTYIETKL